MLQETHDAVKLSPCWALWVLSSRTEAANGNNFLLRSAWQCVMADLCHITLLAMLHAKMFPGKLA